MKAAVLVGVALAAGLIAGCGSNDSSEPSDSSQTYAEQPARGYSEDPTYFEDDPRREEYADEDAYKAFKEEWDSKIEQRDNWALADLCQMYGTPIYSELLRNDYFGGFRYLTCGGSSAAECDAIRTQGDGDLDCYVEPALKKYAAQCKAKTDQVVTPVVDAKELNAKTTYRCLPA